MMNLDQLKSYREWLKQSPQEVLRSVKEVPDGWGRVFPKGLPRWASKVRNFFNETPLWLQLLNSTASGIWIGIAKKQHGYIVDKVRSDGVDGLKYALAVKNALSGDVYLGNYQTIWFQMSPGAAIYHYGSTPKSPTQEAVWVNERAKLLKVALPIQDGITGQNLIPVFKLVSPDGTGGSRECIIKSNLLRPKPEGLAMSAVGNASHVVSQAVRSQLPLREAVIGEGEFVMVSNRIETDPVLQGSYNYSETIDRGPDAHHLSDVKPHSDKKGFYVNPTNPFSSLAERRFRENDNYGKPLADQVQVD